MLGPRKPYDQELADWAKAAELSIPRYFEHIGYAVIRHPHGKCGKDVECISDTERFYVEVERRSGKTWRDGQFPYTVVHVPERRMETMGSNTVLFEVRHDLTLAIAVFYEDVKNAPLEQHDNRYVVGEQFFKVDIKRCLPIDLTDTSDRRSLAERNRQNILRHFASSGNLLLKREVLGVCEPYGMTYQEWFRLLVETECELEPLLGLACKSTTFRNRSGL